MPSAMTSATVPPPGPAGTSPPPPAGPRRLYRSRTDRRVGGVCGGTAAYFNVDSVIVRLVMIGLLLSGVGFLIYPIAWFIVPNAPDWGSRPGGRAWPPPGTGSRRLYRSNTDRRVGGVCGGFAEHLDVDPVVTRLVMFALLIAGIGFLIYPVAWVIIPRAPYGYVPLRTGREREGLDVPIAAWFAGTVVLVLASLDVINWIPLGLVALAVGLYLISRQPVPSTDHRSTPGPQDQPVESEPLWASKPAAEMTDDELHAAAEWTEADLGIGDPPYGPDPTQPRTRRRGLATGALLAVLATAGVAVLSFDASDFAPHGVGDRSYSATTLVELRDEYRLSAGQMTIDLSDLDMEGQAKSVEISVGAGDLTVIVPRDAGGTVSVDVGVGQVNVEGFGRRDTSVDGVGPQVGPLSLSGANGVIDIEVSAKAGEITVRHPGP